MINPRLVEVRDLFLFFYNRLQKEAVLILTQYPISYRTQPKSHTLFHLAHHLIIVTLSPLHAIPHTTIPRTDSFLHVILRIMV